MKGEFWYDYAKLKYGKKAKLCHMDRCSFTIFIEADDIYKDIAKDTSNYKLDRPKGNNKKVIGLMKDELGGKVMTRFVRLRAKAYSYLIDDGSEDKKPKGRKKCAIKRKFKFKSYKICLEATQLETKINVEKNKTDIDTIIENYKEFIKNNKSISKSQQRLKSERHNVFTEDINKIASISNDYKGLQSIDLIDTYAYGTGKDLVSDKSEIKCNLIIMQYKK